MSLVDLYATEARFSQTKEEYDSLMRTLNHQCLGKDNADEKCQKAAELNAQLQTDLIKISNLLVQLKPMLQQKYPAIKEQQTHLLAMSDYLEQEREKLTTNAGAKKDSLVLAHMNEYHYFTWFICSILIGSLVIYEMKKI